MAALHVVGVDQQAWLAVHLGLSGKEQVFVRLVGSDLLCVFAHQYLATEHSPGFSVQNAFVVELAGRVGLGVVYANQVVHVLGIGGQI